MTEISREAVERGLVALNRFNEASDAPLAETARATQHVLEAAYPAIQAQVLAGVKKALHSVETRNAIADALMSGRPNNQERDLKWGESAILTNRQTALTASERIMEALRTLPTLNPNEGEGFKEPDEDLYREENQEGKG